MRRIALTVNGRQVEAEVAPRTSLADFIREHLLLTGTHIGCEHGICGACTVQIDGEIARSCITYAVACDGATIRTIEGFDDDALMARLRRAFTEAHALQCGYCTPGMLVTARDLVRRKRDLSRLQIRQEMSGNLCRCTGYMGIVDAIARVMAEEAAEGVRPCAPAKAGADPTLQPSMLPADARWLGPAPGPVAAPSPERGVRPAGPDPIQPAAIPPPPRAPAVRAPVRVTTGKSKETEGVIRLSQTFVLEHPRDAVWALMSDPEAVARCMPGARLDGPPQDGRVRGRIEVRLGPVAASFSGEGTVTQFPSEYRQLIEGRATDRKGGSRVSGSVEYRLSETAGAEGRAATQVDVVIGYALAGLLAQLGRSSFARDLAQRLGEAFAQNIDAHLRVPSAGAATPHVQIGALSLVLAAMRDRLQAFLSKLLGSRP
jgi:aerobic carbon-monoxide dehydrogenase small subunit